jgi:hypothetical protein
MIDDQPRTPPASTVCRLLAIGYRLFWSLFPDPRSLSPCNAGVPAGCRVGVLARTSLFPVPWSLVPVFLTTNHYPLITAFYPPPPASGTHPPLFFNPPLPPASPFAAFLFPVPWSLVPAFYPPPHTQGPTPPYLFCETVKLWSLPNQQLAATVSQFHSFVFEILVFGGDLSQICPPLRTHSLTPLAPLTPLTPLSATVFPTSKQPAKRLLRFAFYSL